MKQPFEKFGLSHVFVAVLAIFFGWGALYLGYNGLKLSAEYNSSSNLASLAEVSPLASSSATPTATPTPTPTHSASPTPTATPTLTPSTNPTPTASPSATWSATPTATPTQHVTTPVFTTTASPGVTPTVTPAKLGEITVMVGGDMMFDRHIRAVGQAKGYDSIISSARSLFSKADISIANLEGSITNNTSKTLLPNGQTTKLLVFTFSPDVAQAIYNADITAVNLANNHSQNFGTAGLNETKKWLGEANVAWFGDPSNNDPEPAVIQKNGITVAFVGYHAFHAGFENVLKKVSELSAEGDFVIVMPHWGIEYDDQSSPSQKAQARQLVAAGAGAIIGSHPHVVQDHVWMGDVPVFYSIGNLVFDQYFSPDVMKGAIVELHIVKGPNDTKVDHLNVYNTSIASRAGVAVDLTPAYGESIIK